MKTMWIDTHSHFFVWLDKAGAEQELRLAAEAGLRQILVCGGDAATNELARQTAERFGCGFAVGLHPLFVKADWPAQLAWLEAFLETHADHPQLCAVGECGLDGSASGSASLPIQEKVLFQQLRLARRYQLPVSLHGRAAMDLLLKNLRRLPPAGGAIHAFNGSSDQAKHFWSLGLKLGFGGAALYEGSRRIRRMLAESIDSGWVLETDCPDMPSPMRRQSEDPAESHEVDIASYAQEAAQLRAISPEEVSRQTLQNTKEAFPRLAGLQPLRRNSCSAPSSES